MKYIAKILITIIIIFINSCNSKLDNLQQEALKFAIEDNSINEQEFKELINIINSSPEDFKQFFSDDRIDENKVVSYLIKYLKTQKLDLTINDIWTSDKSYLEKESLFNVDVFLENSGSMDGYVNGVTEFENTIYNLLGDIKTSGLCDSLNLHYINNIIPYSLNNAVREDIQNFIEKLEPEIFRKRGGNRSVSDMDKILGTVLNKITNNNVVILISDFVFSPGKQFDAVEYFANQEVSIKINFAQKLKEENISVQFYKLESKFDGVYYNRYDSPIKLKCKRPYYILVMGNIKLVQLLNNINIFEKIRGGYLDKLYFTSNSLTIPNFKILRNPQIGSFDLDEKFPNKSIINAEIERRNHNSGYFGFYLASDFSKLMQENSYFLDSSIYIVNNNYSVNADLFDEKNKKGFENFTHRLVFKTKDLKDEELKVNIIKKIPLWVYNSTSIDDSYIKDDSLEQKKTLGLKYLITGIFNAYIDNSSPLIASFSINIKKSSPNYNLFYILFILLILAISIYFYKKKSN